MTNSALNRTTILQLRNKSGSTQSQGAVVILDTANEKSFKTTTTAGYTATRIGVVTEPAGIANNAIGAVAFAGWVPKINLTSSASVGNLISTSTVAGQGAPVSQVDSGNFAETIKSGTSPEAYLYGYTTQSTGSTIVDVGDRWFDNSTGEKVLFQEAIPILSSGVLKTKGWGILINEDALAKNINFVFYLDTDSCVENNISLPPGIDYNWELETALIDIGGNQLLHTHNFTMQKEGSIDSSDAKIQIDQNYSFGGLPNATHVYKIVVNIADADTYFESYGTLLEGPYYR